MLVKKVPEVVLPEEYEVDPEVAEPEAQEVEPVLEVDVDHRLHPCPHQLWRASTNRHHHLDLADSHFQERDSPNVLQYWICPLCSADMVTQFHHSLAVHRE